MIVACPACSTRYRNDRADTGMTATCSRCDASFPVRPARRSYVVLGGQRSPFGMQTPALAAASAGATAIPEPSVAAANSVAGPWLDFVLALVPSSAAAAIAYYYAVGYQVDPVTWTALGGAAGLLLGWGCLLWIRRAD